MRDGRSPKKLVAASSVAGGGMRWWSRGHSHEIHITRDGRQDSTSGGRLSRLTERQPELREL